MTDLILLAWLGLVLLGILCAIGASLGGSVAILAAFALVWFVSCASSTMRRLDR